jgi:uncharacterized protein YlxW (UPF0749 family)
MDKTPSDFDSLREDFATAFTAISDYAGTQRRHAELVTAEVERLWADNAELRDEINAVANRVESLTRAVMADPADVAQAIVNDANRSTLREVREDG